jgi:nicotinate-nucleotide adenylyltransferase
VARQIGIYGGTFDPVHHGHLLLARDAVELLALDQLIFVPAAISPHKLERGPSASGEARLAMLEAAIEGEPRFVADDCELRRAGPSYAVETVEALRAQFPPGTEFFYLIGEDNVAELGSWHRIEALKSLVRFVVFRRGAAREDAGFPVLERRVDISATEIRNRVASGLPIRYLVPEAVRAAIDAGSLYRPPAQGAESLPPKP